MIDKFNKIYDDIYEGIIEVNMELVDKFDELLHSNKEFKDKVREFVKCRGDFLSSDIECQAYMMLIEQDFN